MFPQARNHRVFARGYFVVVLIVCTIGFMYAILPTRVSYEYTENIDILYKQIYEVNLTRSTDEVKIKYILQWNTRESPFNIMEEGQTAFYKHDCEHKNCFVTDNRKFFGDITKFDAIAFSGKYMPSPRDLPSKRLDTQKYIFGATESAHNYRICNPVYDGFFNWTWTYRLDSDIRWGYITIYDLEGHKVGPKTDMTWPELAPVSDEFKRKLDSKNKVVAWFVSHCRTLSLRELFVSDLIREAEYKYGWTVDVYGSCGHLKCTRDKSSQCFDILQRDYYFYLSFENSFAEDYVTEKLLNALNNDAVPIVFGSANYSRQVYDS